MKSYQNKILLTQLFFILNTKITFIFHWISTEDYEANKSEHDFHKVFSEDISILSELKYLIHFY